MQRLFLAAASALVLAGCATGSDYALPSIPRGAGESFQAAQGPAFATQSQAQDDWWRLYNDPVLDRLVSDALAANTDIRVALARVAAARAGLRGAGADRLPTADLSASPLYGRQPAGQRPPGGKTEDWSVDAGLNLAYELDLFGRVSQGVEAAQGDLDAATADADAVRVMVAAETARAYADAVSAGTRLNVANQVVALLDQSLSVTQERGRVGLSSPLDVARISALRNQRQADVPALEAERQAALFRLAALTGRTPAELPAEARERTATLRLSDPIPVGDGAALLARRPDVRAAERRLSAASARIGVATADLYPRITLSASGGSTGIGFDDFLEGGPLRWMVGPILSWPLNQAGARARIAGAEANSQEALAAFDGAVLEAVRETETALSAYSHALQRREALLEARNQAARAAEIVRARRREGAIDALESLDAERTLADAEAALALADAAIAERQIDLFRALGGGWRTAADPQAVAGL